MMNYSRSLPCLSKFRSSNIWWSMILLSTVSLIFGFKVKTNCTIYIFLWFEAKLCSVIRTFRLLSYLCIFHHFFCFTSKTQIIIIYPKYRQIFICFIFHLPLLLSKQKLASQNICAVDIMHVSVTICNFTFKGYVAIKFEAHFLLVG